MGSINENEVCDRLVNSINWTGLGLVNVKCCSDMFIWCIECNAKKECGEKILIWKSWFSYTHCRWNMWWWVSWILSSKSNTKCCLFHRIILESDPIMVMQRVQIRQDDVPLGEQTVSQVSRSTHKWYRCLFSLSLSITLRYSIRDWIFYSIMIDRQLNMCVPMDKTYFWFCSHFLAQQICFYLLLCFVFLLD